MKRSTTTIIWVQPWDSGNWVIKSVEIEVHAVYGTSSGSSNPYFACLGDLLC